EIEDQPSRQCAGPLFPTPILVNDPIDQLHRKHPSQHTNRSPVGQTAALAHTQPKIHHSRLQPRHDLTDRHCGKTHKAGDVVRSKNSC
ncbi:hypothetical protein CLV40_1551, partial [Actinokineospora auranticolor]